MSSDFCYFLPYSSTKSIRLNEYIVVFSVLLFPANRKNLLNLQVVFENNKILMI
ncbi:MAG: hypothetical protein H6Q13_1582 [Bacteroidetes bacterium]|nr:hypothetical protein [Bacteroidota bacterium]